jgi:hypothetical protein
MQWLSCVRDEEDQGTHFMVLDDCKPNVCALSGDATTPKGDPLNGTKPGMSAPQAMGVQSEGQRPSSKTRFSGFRQGGRVESSANAGLTNDKGGDEKVEIGNHGIRVEKSNGKVTEIGPHGIRITQGNNTKLNVDNNGVLVVGDHNNRRQRQKNISPKTSHRKPVQVGYSCRIPCSCCCCCCYILIIIIIVNMLKKH